MILKHVLKALKEFTITFLFTSNSILRKKNRDEYDDLFLTIHIKDQARNNHHAQL